MGKKAKDQQRKTSSSGSEASGGSFKSKEFVSSEKVNELGMKQPERVKSYPQKIAPVPKKDAENKNIENKKQPPATKAEPTKDKEAANDNLICDKSEQIKVESSSKVPPTKPKPKSKQKKKSKEDQAGIKKAESQIEELKSASTSKIQAPAVKPKPDKDSKSKQKKKSKEEQQERKSSASSNKQKQVEPPQKEIQTEQVSQDSVKEPVQVVLNDQAERKQVRPVEPIEKPKPSKQNIPDLQLATDTGFETATTPEILSPGVLSPDTSPEILKKEVQPCEEVAIIINHVDSEVAEIIQEDKDQRDDFGKRKPSLSELRKILKNSTSITLSSSGDSGRSSPLFSPAAELKRRRATRSREESMGRGSTIATPDIAEEEEGGLHFKSNKITRARISPSPDMSLDNNRLSTRTARSERRSSKVIEEECPAQVTSVSKEDKSKEQSTISNEDKEVNEEKECNVEIAPIKLVDKPEEDSLKSIEEKIVKVAQDIKDNFGVIEGEKIIDEVAEELVEEETIKKEDDKPQPKKTSALDFLSLLPAEDRSFFATGIETPALQIDHVTPLPEVITPEPSVETVSQEVKEKEENVEVIINQEKSAKLEKQPVEILKER